MSDNNDVRRSVRLSVAGYDLNGNAVSNIARTVLYTNALPSPVGNMMFSEIMFNPAIPNAEYLELFNASSNFADHFRSPVFVTVVRPAPSQSNEVVRLTASLTLVSTFSIRPVAERSTSV